MAEQEVAVLVGHTVPNPAGDRQQQPPVDLGDEYSQWAAVLAASRTTTVPVDVGTVVAALLTEKETP